MQQTLELSASCIAYQAQSDIFHQMDLLEVSLIVVANILRTRTTGLMSYSLGGTMSPFRSLRHVICTLQTLMPQKVPNHRLRALE